MSFSIIAKRRLLIGYGMYLVLVFLSLVMSCYQDVIVLDLGDHDNRIVIECLLTDNLGPIQVKISRTVAINQMNVFPPENNAFVLLSDDAGNSEELIQTQSGCYQASEIQGVPGRTYTLHITVDGEEYTAVSKMPDPVELDSMALMISNGYFYSVECFFEDNLGSENFYRLKTYIDGTLNDDIFYQDRFADGDRIRLESKNNLFRYGNLLKLEFYALDRISYNYLFVTSSSAEGMDIELPGFFPQGMYNPVSNWSNGALGYFSAAALKTYTFDLKGTGSNVDTR